MSASTIGLALEPVAPPIDQPFYDRLQAARSSFTKVDEHTVERGTGYGLRVSAGQAFRLVTVERAQIVDLCLTSAEDPTEHYAAGTQLAWEGGFVSRGNRIWGTAPRSRPLAACTADTLRPKDDASHARDHVSHGAHCNAHHWMLYTGTHPRTCYDNLRAGFAMLGLHQRYVHDNMNIYQKTALDPHTGQYLEGLSDAEAGDYIEFYAETDLLVVVSLCPQGSGADTLHGGDDDWVPYFDMPVYPIRIEVYDTGITPQGWPVSR
ncbi:MAG: hypothetical protein JWO02_1516 [Solirubrobacterales bacterium]|nr:hypothetical protein [Solirubrobacterales bacterium]